ncbi:hypothetical protein QUF75_20865 [Desulfococcaceae bacterium HSG7]|nr:hypothetical protein [Desulfococcaceae bacterium HSG7]
MSLTDRFLEKWQQSKDSRYPVIFIVPSQKNVLSDTSLQEFADLIGGASADFAKRYQGALETFLTRKQVQEEINSIAQNSPVVMINLEPFYSKWTVDERLAFIRYMLRSEPPQGIVMVLYCQEDLSAIRAIPDNNRGIIWTI